MKNEKFGKCTCQKLLSRQQMKPNTPPPLLSDPATNFFVLLFVLHSPLATSSLISRKDMGVGDGNPWGGGI